MARIKPQALLIQSKKKKGPNRMSLTTILLFGLIVALALYFLVSTFRRWSSHRSRSSLSADNHEAFLVTDNSDLDTKKTDLPGYATIITPKGSITVEFFKDSSPEVVDEFIDLCQKGQFKGMLFRHIIKHYVIQAGDIDKPGTIEEWTTGGKHYSHLDSSLKHEAFMLGTSKAKLENRGFDLFITTAPMPDLNEKLIVFGRVIMGEDVVQEIEEVDTDENYQPKSAIGITNVILKQKI